MSQQLTDFGKAVLRDPETGDVYVDQDGNYVTIEGEELFRQACVIAMETVRGEELIDSEYGFPLLDAMKNIDNIDPETAIKLAIYETLTRTRIPMIKDVYVGEINNDGDGKWEVPIVIKSIRDKDTNISIGVDTLFQKLSTD
jgi:hypothetical protein